MIEDEYLENLLINNYEDEKELLDEYKNNDEDPEFEDMDEQLADPRAYPHPKPWRWLRRVSISCTIQCTNYNLCLVRSTGCKHPRGCVCNRFAWEGK